MRFYFHLQNNNNERLDDTEGVEAADATEAIKAAREEVAEARSAQIDMRGWTMVIVDSNGMKYAELPL